jgi:CubicO group peptidase (beta-lactamase class C family)
MIASARMDPLFAEWDKRDSPGCALAIVQDGQIAYARGYGMANLEYDIPLMPGSVFHIASISKQFTTMAIALLEQEGQLSFEDDMRKYLPEMPDYGVPITLRHLAHHTSGLRDQWDLLFLAGWREDDLKTNADVLYLASRQKVLNFKPGDEYLYSNTGYTLLALIVERVSGKSFRQFTTERIFTPLQMTQTHFHDDHSMIVKNRAYGYLPKPDGGFRISIPNFDTIGASSLFTTIEDLARWSNNYAHAIVGGQPVIEKMLKPGVLNDGEMLGYALGVSIAPYRGLRTFGHSGADAGYRSDFIAFPDHGLAIILFCNLGSMNPARLTRKVADVLLEAQLEPVGNAPVISTNPEALKCYTGVYRSLKTDETFQVEARDGQLLLPIVPDFQLALLALDEYRFTAPEWGLEFAFTDGDQQRMEVRQTGSRRTPRTFERVESAQPTAAQLEAYIGVYRSDELETSYTVKLENEKLLLFHSKHGSMALLPTTKDGFIAVSSDARADLVFSRNSEGQIGGFALTTGRVRRQYMSKVLLP